MAQTTTILGTYVFPSDVSDQLAQTINAHLQDLAERRKARRKDRKLWERGLDEFVRVVRTETLGCLESIRKAFMAALSDHHPHLREADIAWVTEWIKEVVTPFRNTGYSEIYSSCFNRDVTGYACRESAKALRSDCDDLQVTWISELQRWEYLQHHSTSQPASSTADSNSPVSSDHPEATATPPRSEQRCPMTDGQKAMWDALDGRTLSGKQLATKLTTTEEVIRRWVLELRRAGYEIENRRGRGYYRTDALPAEAKDDAD